MPLFTWNDSYSVSVQQSDDRHKVIFNLVNNLHEAMSKGKARGKMGNKVAELLQYTRSHFSAKEAAERHYPQYLHRKKQHDIFTCKVAEFEKECRSGQTALSVIFSASLALRSRPEKR